MNGAQALPGLTWGVGSLVLAPPVCDTSATIWLFVGSDHERGARGVHNHEKARNVFAPLSSGRRGVKSNACQPDPGVGRSDRTIDREVVAAAAADDDDVPDEPAQVSL